MFGAIVGVAAIVVVLMNVVMSRRAFQVEVAVVGVWIALSALGLQGGVNYTVSGIQHLVETGKTPGSSHYRAVARVDMRR